MKISNKNDQCLQNFCNNVYRIRKSHNLTQKEMAKICGIGVSTLSKVESGILPPRLSTDVLFILQQHFQIPIHKLFDEKLF